MCSANGRVLIAIGDGSGDANIVVLEKTGLEYRTALYGSTMLAVSGDFQREGKVLHLIAGAWLTCLRSPPPTVCVTWP